MPAKPDTVILEALKKAAAEAAREISSQRQVLEDLDFRREVATKVLIRAEHAYESLRNAVLAQSNGTEGDITRMENGDTWVLHTDPLAQTR